MNWLKINLNLDTKMQTTSSDKGKYSPEVEEILLKKPSLLVRQGILMLAILVAGILIGSGFIRLPEKLSASVTFDTLEVNGSVVWVGQVILTSAAASVVESGQPVAMVIQAVPQASPVNLTGVVETLQPIGHGDYYRVFILPDKAGKPEGSSGTADILIGEASLLSKILNPVFAVFRSADR